MVFILAKLMYLLSVQTISSVFSGLLIELVVSSVEVNMPVCSVKEYVEVIVS